MGCIASRRTLKIIAPQLKPETVNPEPIIEKQAVNIYIITDSII